MTSETFENDAEKGEFVPLHERSSDELQEMCDKLEDRRNELYLNATTNCYLASAAETLVAETREGRVDDELRIRIWEALKTTDIVTNFQFIEYGVEKSKFGFLIIKPQEINPYLEVPIVDDEDTKGGIATKPSMRGGGVYRPNNRTLSIYGGENVFTNVIRQSLFHKGDMTELYKLAHEMSHDSNASLLSARSHRKFGGVFDHWVHRSFVSETTAAEKLFNDSPVGEFVSEVLSDISTMSIGAHVVEGFKHSKDTVATIVPDDALPADDEVSASIREVEESRVYFTSYRVINEPVEYVNAKTLPKDKMHEIEDIVHALSGAGVHPTTLGIGLRNTLVAELHDDPNDRTPIASQYFSPERVYGYFKDALQELGYSEQDIPDLKSKNMLMSQVRNAQFRDIVLNEIVVTMKDRYGEGPMPVYSTTDKTPEGMLNTTVSRFPMPTLNEKVYVSVTSDTINGKSQISVQLFEVYDDETSGAMARVVSDIPTSQLDAISERFAQVYSGLPIVDGALMTNTALGVACASKAGMPVIATS